MTYLILRLDTDQAAVLRVVYDLLRLSSPISSVT